MTLSRDDVVDIYPLTSFQEGLLYHDMLSRDRDGARRDYYQQLTFRMLGRLDRDAFARSWAWLVARHAILRSVFRTGGGERPYQLVLRRSDFGLQTRDLSALEPDRREAAVEERVREERERPFDLGRDPPMRVACLTLGPTDHVVVWSLHHILVDGWCIGILQGELAEAYAAFAAGREPDAPPAPSFGSHVAWAEARRDAHALAYWARYLESYAPRPLLPRLAPGSRPGDAVRATVPVAFGPELTLRLVTAARRHGVTLNSLVQALWGVLLARCDGRRDVVFGAIVSTRPPDLPGSDRIVGPCVAAVPLRVKYGAGETLLDLVRRLHAQAPEWIGNAQCALADIQARCCGGATLFDHYIAFENYPLDERFRGESQRFADGIAIAEVRSFITTNYGFAVLASPGAELRLDLCFSPEAMDEAAARDLAARLRGVAAAAADDIASVIDDLPILLPGEAEALLAWSRGPAPAPRARSVTEARRAVTAAGGGRPALRAGDVVLTHDDVQARAEALARGLRDRFSVRPGEPVAVLATPEPGTVCAVLACLLLGAPFVPLDPAAPEARNAHILGDCGARVLVVPEGRPAPAVPGVAQLTLAAAAAGAGPAALDEVPEGAPAYVVYTSGTTGAPKGVRVGQAALLNYVGWLARDLAVSAEDRSALVTSMAHDLGYTVLFGSLLLGGCLSLVGEDERRDPDHMAALLRRHRATWLKATPAYAALLLRAGPGELAGLGELRLVLLGGEPQRFADLRRLSELLPGAAFYNHYGPTEATIGCVAGPLDAALLAGARPPQRIGRPIAGAAVMICDGVLDPVPWGIPGEIVVTGAGLAQGYVGGAGEDAARFVTIPRLGGARGYRTGDWGEWLPDGTIAFHGRRDDQVKVRGHRIGLQAVERALAGLPAIREAAVLAEAAPDGEAELIAFIVPAAGAETSAGALRAALSAILPEPMVPGRFLPVSRLPLTPNGKVDRNALRSEGRRLASRPAGPPQRGSALAEELRRLWADVLFQEEVGLDDDFFALGGHSIKAVVLVSRVRTQLKRPLTIRDLYDHPTVARLARHLGERTAATGRLLALRAAPAAAPVALFLPPVLGSSTVYKELVDHFTGGIACHGLQCPGFDRDEPLAASVAELADLFAANAAMLPSDRPLRLVGWSMGAHLALEVALRLEGRGRAVRLVLIDAVSRLGEGDAVPGIEPDFSDLATLAQQRYWAGVLGVLSASLLPGERDRLERVAVGNNRMMRHYRFGGIVAADIFCIEALDNGRPAGMARFGAATSGQCSLERVAGDHYSIFQPPNVADLARRVERALTIPDGTAARRGDVTDTPPRADQPWAPGRAEASG